MKISIVIPVLDSYEVVRRQVLHWRGLNLSADTTEIVLVDDGSEPPISIDARDLPIKVFQTHDKRPWTWALARNAGARVASGEFLIMTDIDHILTRDIIDHVCRTQYPKVQFKREFAVLDESGKLTQDHQVLLDYGLEPRRLKQHGVSVKPLPNNFAMRRDVFWELGGYREDRIGKKYPQGEDASFRKTWQAAVDAGKYQVDTFRPTIYTFPTGQFCGDVDYNPFGLFHNLSRKSSHNWFHTRKK